MPVYEYECPQCQTVLEIQQKIADPPIGVCPECGGAVKKLMSMSSFQLKGGGWYADGYTSAQDKAKKDDAPAAPACPAAAAGCSGCPAAAASGK